METMRKLLKYEVDKKFVVFTVLLLLFNLLVNDIKFNHFYWYIFMFSIDYYSLKYVLIISKNDRSFYVNR